MRPKIAEYYFVLFLKKLKELSGVVPRLVKLTGKHKEAIHPKHLVQVELPWYEKYLKKDWLVLDVGCNNGQHSLRMAKKVKKVVGIDYDRRQLNIALRTKDKNRCEFVLGDVENGLPFKDKAFEAVAFFDVLEHLNDDRTIIVEIARVLKKGGVLLLAVPNSETKWKKRQRGLGVDSMADPDHKREYTISKIRKLINSYNFDITSKETIVYDTQWEGLINLIGGFSLGLYKKLTQWKKNMVMRFPDESTGFRIVAVKT